ncbi:RICIN domain-containing protein [Streptomyces sp. NPDC056323]|uniref:RICIN domain-containing protein n=1 Tax=Streptomyces sp. NPDC056323 TaxID=3345784 RepID=UPI0035DC29A2
MGGQPRWPQGWTALRSDSSLLAFGEERNGQKRRPMTDALRGAAHGRDAGRPGPEKWAIDPVTSTTFLLRNLNSDMCVTAVNGADLEALQQRPCDSRWDEQIFSMDNSSKPNRYQLKNQAHNKCLVPYATTAPTYARVAACSATNGYMTHSFDVR